MNIEATLKHISAVLEEAIEYVKAYDVDVTRDEYEVAYRVYTSFVTRNGFAHNYPYIPPV